MLIRYRKTEEGKVAARALVYTAEEHGIDPARVDADARRIVERLRENGHEAYIVGGAVRDLLLGRTPKDFDIVTDAEPARIKRVFRNSRVIGRRFRLVHVYAGPKIFEVSTFRSIANGTIGNEYGTIDEDALRRDFTCNALYYDPLQRQLVDYVSGFKHVKARRIVPVIPLSTIFTEDPVRMIRCLKYAATTGFRIPFRTRWAIKRDAGLLAGASTSRLTEEFLKILACGRSSSIFAELDRYGLLGHIVPECSAFIAKDGRNKAALLESLSGLDDLDVASSGRERRLSILISHFLKPWLESLEGVLEDKPDAFQEALQHARTFLAPLNLPRVELEAAVLMLFKKRGLSPLERPRRPGPERGRSPAERGRGPRSSQRGARTVSEAAAPGPAAPGPAKAPADADDSPPADRPTDASAPKRRRRGRRKSGGPTAGANLGSPDAGAEGASRARAPSGAERGAESGLSKTSGAARRRRKRQKKSGDSSPEA